MPRNNEIKSFILFLDETSAIWLLQIFSVKCRIKAFNNTQLEQVFNFVYIDMEQNVLDYEVIQKSNWRRSHRIHSSFSVEFIHWIIYICFDSNI